MRPRALSLLACLAVAAPLSAQDAFSRVTVEPRPEEHLQWDAAAGESMLYALININEPEGAN